MVIVAVLAAAANALVMYVFVSRMDAVLSENVPEFDQVFDDLKEVDISGATEEQLALLEDQVSDLENKLREQDDANRLIYRAAAPAIFLMMASTFVVSVFAVLAYLCCALSAQSALHLLGTALRMFPAFLVHFLLLFLLSGTWLYLFGALSPAFTMIALVIAVVVVPRIILSPVLFVRDRLGIIGSIRHAVAVTKGKWLTVLTLLGAMALTVGFSIFLGYFLALFLGGLSTSLFALFFFLDIVRQLGTAAVTAGIAALAGVLVIPPVNGSRRGAV